MYTGDVLLMLTNRITDLEESSGNGELSDGG